MKIEPYIAYNGRCEEAFERYAKVFGGKIDMVAKYGGSPMEEQVPAELHDKVMHASLSFGDESIMGFDEDPTKYREPGGVSISVNLDSAKEARRLFDEFAGDGKVLMPFEKTFWAAGFGVVHDVYGVVWMFNCEQEQE